MSDSPRVLLVHNRYSSDVPSGENAVVGEQRAGLQARGIAVEQFVADNDSTKHSSAVVKAMALPSMVWSMDAAARLRATIDDFRPTVIHVHNVFPLLSPSVMKAAVRSGIPTVWTVHNYRIGCVAGTHYYRGAPCDACASSFRLAGVRRGCYAGSVVASGAVTVASSAFKKLARSVTTVAISTHVREWLVARHGFDPDRIVVMPNGIPDPGVPSSAPSTHDDVVLVSRLAREKGVLLALDAWTRRRARTGRLLIAGDGPLAADVRRAAASDPTIVMLGMLTSREVLDLLARSRVVLAVPECEETFGRTAAESLAVGRPVVATNRGGLTDVVDDTVGRLVPPEPVAVAAAVDELIERPELADELGKRARDRWRRQFDLDITLDRLLDLYGRMG